MSNKVNESFSAFLDGEASEVDVQRLLKAMADDRSAIQQWQRLSEVHATARGWPLADASVSVTAGTALKPESKQRSYNGEPRFDRILAAASVAVVLLVSVAWLGGRNAVEPIHTQAMMAAPTEAEVENTVFVQHRLEQMLKQHVERASFTTGRAVVPSSLTIQQDAAI